MSTTRRIITAAVAVAAAVGVASCDAQQVGAAAVIGDDRFSVADLQEQVEEVQRLDGFSVEAVGGVSGFQRELLTRHIQHQLFLHLAEKENIEVTEAAVDDMIEEFEGQAPDGDLAPLLAQSGYTEASFRDGVTDELIAQAYMEETGADESELTQALVDAGDELGVEVNPRYGAWGDDLTVSTDTGSISEAVTPAPEADAPGAGQ